MKTYNQNKNGILPSPKFYKKTNKLGDKGACTFAFYNKNIDSIAKIHTNNTELNFKTLNCNYVKTISLQKIEILQNVQFYLKPLLPLKHFF